MKLEKQFFNAYVNNIKMILHESEGTILKQKIIDILKDSNDMNFEQSFMDLMKIISEITEEHFEFIEYEEDVLLSLYDVGNCYSKDEKHQYCHYENGENKLLIPKTNLYTKEDNQKRYVEYLTHDLLLNSVFQTKFMDNIQIIIDDNVSYNMTKSEIILIESLIKEYFSTLKQKKSSYIDHSVFEDMMPHEIFDEMEHAIFDDNDDF